ncbi:MAG: trypsin-like serine protease [Silvanigrellales bacterium]|nr:trypsin-like serine protease [Silvanigrellales bacterium]
MRKGTSCSFVVLIALSGACTSREFNGGTETELSGGRIVQSDKYPGLLQIKNLECSGVKIGKNHILTAKHCVKFSRPKDILVLAHIDPSARPGSFAPLIDFQVNILRILKHPDTGVSKNRDIAIVEIESSSQFQSLQTALLENDTVENGDSVHVVGFGCTERSDVSESQTLATSPVRRSHSSSPPNDSPNISTRTSPKEAVCHAVVSGASELTGSTHLACQMRTASHFQSVPGLCYGDSGGPLYTNAAPHRVVGVNSHFRPGKLADFKPTNAAAGPSSSSSLAAPRYGVSTFVRVDAGAKEHQQWIQDALSARPSR